MAENTSGAGTDGTDGTSQAKAKFSQALDDAKAGVSALGKEAQQQAEHYRGQFEDKAKGWQEDAKLKASELAAEGKTRASDAIASIGKLVSDNAPLIDEKLGSQYGDYARGAGRHMQEAAAKLDSKSIDEISEEAKEFVRKSPGLAVGIAAAAGFMLSRIFTRKS